MSAHTTGWRSPWLEEGLRKGREEGRAEAKEEIRLAKEGAATEEARLQERARFVLEILDRRDIEVPKYMRMAISECRDMDVLTRWKDRAFSVTTANELFADD